MKAVFLRNLDGFTGHASLYKLDEEVGYYVWNEPEKFAGYTRYVVVSATAVMPSGPETYIFPADEDGTVLSWQEITGYRGGLDHAEALRRMGATIWYAPEDDDVHDMRGKMSGGGPERDVQRILREIAEERLLRKLLVDVRMMRLSRKGEQSCRFRLTKSS